MINFSIKKLLLISNSYTNFFSDHFVKLSLFLNCNKIKKLGVNKTQQIVDAVAGD